MLCCGLLTLIAVTGGLWRWLRVGLRAMWAIGAAAIVAGPAIALAATAPSSPLSRSDIIARAMHSLCGTP